MDDKTDCLHANDRRRDVFLSANDDTTDLLPDNIEYRRIIDALFLTRTGQPHVHLWRHRPRVEVSRQQTIVATLTTVAEIIACAQGQYVAECATVLSDIGIRTRQSIRLCVDSMLAVRLLREESSCAARCSRAKAKSNLFAVKACIADLLTKALARPTFQFLRKRCEIVPLKR